VTAQWIRVGSDEGPVVVHTQVDDVPRPDDELADIGRGLAERFPEVYAVDFDRTGRTAMCVHAVVDHRGNGCVVETSLRSTSDGPLHVSNWVSPTGSYLRDLAAARTLMSGGNHPYEEAPDAGVAVAEAHLSIQATELAIRRRGPVAQIATDDGAIPLVLRASALPVWLFARLVGGMRPAPGDRRVHIGPWADVAISGTGWTLDWAHGYDTTLEPSDEDWSTAVVTQRGRIEMLDRGAHGLWRVTDVPDDLREPGDTGEEVAVCPTTAAALWAELTLLAAD
jgi:hypothetical protein